MQTLRITTQLPEPAATLYQVRPGDRLEPIAARIYRQAIQPGRDLRFYENVIHHVNVKSGRKRDPARSTVTSGWSRVTASGW